MLECECAVGGTLKSVKQTQFVSLSPSACVDETRCERRRLYVVRPTASVYACITLIDLMLCIKQTAKATFAYVDEMRHRRGN